MSKPKPPIIWMTIDPGETTGWAIWRDAKRIEAGQHKLQEFADLLWEWASTGEVPDEFNTEGWHERSHETLDWIVAEDWQLYEKEALNLIWDRQRTVRLIGMIELTARVNGIPIEFQGAAIKEVAEAAGAKDMFYSPVHENRHANDAMMHGVYYLARNGVPGRKRRKKNG